MVFWYKNWFFGNISNYKFQKNHYLECFWTFIPIVILVGLGYESLMNLCAGEVSDDLDYKVKITAHQWY
jgi:heme/copper-type cytochrome/quinol oxidase subunit 2